MNYATYTNKTKEVVISQMDKDPKLVTGYMTENWEQYTEDLYAVFASGDIYICRDIPKPNQNFGQVTGRTWEKVDSVPPTTEYIGHYPAIEIPTK